jgi:hypothetical protein
MLAMLIMTNELPSTITIVPKAETDFQCYEKDYNDMRSSFIYGKISGVQ